MLCTVSQPDERHLERAMRMTACAVTNQPRHAHHVSVIQDTTGLGSAACGSYRVRLAVTVGLPGPDSTLVVGVLELCFCSCASGA